ncbi:MAG: LemA family protein [Firmicutes bacterium]|nr:LemA family protein [Bacillota bacterium]
MTCLERRCSMNPIYVVLIAIAIIALIFVVWYISTSNKLNILVVKVDESLSGIDIALTKRYDVLTKMIDVVKAYSKHEKETLFEVIKLRDNMSLKEKSNVNHAMDENLKKINIIAENYPELKSSENYQTLQQSIADVEEHLQAARRLYNSNVSLYNQQLVTFPTSVVAKNKGMTKKDFFEIDEIKRNDVKIEL